MPRLLARRGAQQLSMTGHLCCWNSAVAGRAVAPRLLLTYSVPAIALCLPTCRNVRFSCTWCDVRMLLALLLHSTDCLKWYLYPWSRGACADPLAAAGGRGRVGLLAEGHDGHGRRRRPAHHGDLLCHAAQGGAQGAGAAEGAARPPNTKGMAGHGSRLCRCRISGLLLA